MPEATLLLIQADDSPATRVVELPGPSVRIGRGKQCEVHLGEPTLAEVQCMLRRRGETWHIQPVGPPGRVSINGRPVDVQRPLPLGVPVRVGDHWLTLRPADDSVAAAEQGRNAHLAATMGTYREPISAGASLAPTPTPTSTPTPTPTSTPTPRPTRPEGLSSPEPVPPAGPDGKATGPGLDAERERLERWQARLEQRERWLKDHADERRWESRWRAAGASLRARSNPPTTPRPTAPPSRLPVPPPSVAEPALPRMAEVDPRRVGWPAATARSHARAGIEPEMRGPLPTVPEGPPAPLEPVAPPPEVAASAALLLPPIGPSPTPEDGLAPSSHDDETPQDVAPPAPPNLAEVGPEPELDPVDEPVASVAAELPADQTPDSAPGSRPMTDEPRLTTFTLGTPTGPAADGETTETGQGGEPKTGSARGRSIPGVVWQDIRVEGASVGRSVIPLLRDEAAQPGASSGLGTSSILRPTPPPPSPSSMEVPPGPLTTPGEPEPADDSAKSSGDDDRAPAPFCEPTVNGCHEWPSARTIFAAREAARAAAMSTPAHAGHRARVKAKPKIRPARTSAPPSAGARAAWVQAAPTHAQHPAQWSMPLWPAWVLAVLLLLPAGMLGLALSWTWAEDDRAAASLANALLVEPEPTRPEDSDRKPADGPQLDVSNAPEAAWWRSTASHLYLWALAVDRSGAGSPPDPEQSDRVRYYLHAARSASPVHAATRYTLAEQGGSRGPGGQADPLGEALGSSRDVLPLTSAGKHLLAAGKTEAALRAFAESLDLAARAELKTLDPPPFLDDPETRRYALPHEVLMTPAIRAMAEHRDWTFADWSSALPACSVAPLVAGRVLKELGRGPEADAALNLALSQAENPPPAGCSEAVHAAAGAEALALQQRWSQAAEQYRRAMDLMSDDATRRSWWFNTAELCARLDDDSGRLTALEHAKGSNPNDEITRRAVLVQTQAGLASTTTRPAPAPKRDAVSLTSSSGSTNPAPSRPPTPTVPAREPAGERPADPPPLMTETVPPAAAPESSPPPPALDGPPEALPEPTAPPPQTILPPTGARPLAAPALSLPTSVDRGLGRGAQGLEMPPERRLYRPARGRGK